MSRSSAMIWLRGADKTKGKASLPKQATGRGGLQVFHAGLLDTSLRTLATLLRSFVPCDHRQRFSAAPAAQLHLSCYCPLVPSKSLKLLELVSRIVQFPLPKPP